MSTITELKAIIAQRDQSILNLNTKIEDMYRTSKCCCPSFIKCSKHKNKTRIYEGTNAEHTRRIQRLRKGCPAKKFTQVLTPTEVNEIIRQNKDKMDKGDKDEDTEMVAECDFEGEQEDEVASELFGCEFEDRPLISMPPPPSSPPCKMTLPPPVLLAYTPSIVLDNELIAEHTTIIGLLGESDNKPVKFKKRAKKYQLQEDIKEEVKEPVEEVKEPVEDVKEPVEDVQPEPFDFLKVMTMGELKSHCKTINLKGYSKYKTKTALISFINGAIPGTPVVAGGDVSSPTVAGGDFNKMSSTELRKYCKDKQLRGFSKYTKKEALLKFILENK